MNAPAPLKPLVGNPQENERHDEERAHRHSAYAAEATGLILMAVVLLVIAVIRYWRHIPWSAR